MHRAAIVLSLAVAVNTLAVAPVAASLAAEGTPAATPVSAADPELAARFFDVSFNQGNPTAAGLLSPAFVFHLVGQPDLDAGGFAAFVGGFRTAFPDLHVEVQTAFAQGDRIAARWALRGTQEGPFQGIPATHKAVLGVPGHAILRVAAGEVAEVWAIIDAVGLLQQLGLWPGPAASAEAGPTAPAPGAPPDGDAVAVVTRFYAASAAGDTAAAEQLIAADFVGHPRGATSTSGREGFRQNDAAWRAIFPDASPAVEDVVASGDLVMARLTTTATQRGAYGSIPPTGTTVVFASMDLWRVRNGQLAELWVVWDNLGLVQQLQAAAAPGGTPTG